VNISKSISGVGNILGIIAEEMWENGKCGNLKNGEWGNNAR